eukprot:scaffold36604_cov31-Tisochrysis_lutea.AAC.1
MSLQLESSDDFVLFAFNVVLVKANVLPPRFVTEAMESCHEGEGGVGVWVRQHPVSVIGSGQYVECLCELKPMTPTGNSYSSKFLSLFCALHIVGQSSPEVLSILLRRARIPHMRDHQDTVERSCRDGKASKLLGAMARSMTTFSHGQSKGAKS